MIKVGRVSYLNTLPLFYSWNASEVELVEGHPSQLVDMLRKNLIQAGIVSSAEYLLNPDYYRVVQGISISSREKACSVLLFSKKPIERIQSVYLTPASLTSKLLALYLLRVYESKPRIVTDPSGAEALLLIGDEALAEKKSGRWQYIYDLGEEWFRLYRLPFVFALFLVRRDAPLWLDRLIEEQCGRSKEEFYERLSRGDLSVKGYTLAELTEYFTLCLDYGLTEKSWKSLEIFNRILRKEGIVYTL